MLVALQSVDDGLEILRVRLRGFEVVNRDGADFRLADDDAAVDNDLPAIGMDRVRGFTTPVAVHVDRVLVRSSTTGDQPGFSVRLDYPEEPLDVFVGLETPDRPFPFNRVYELTSGDTITVCPGNSRCETRKVTVRKRQGRWYLGPCALSGWFGGEMQDSTRTFSLLDLYHYAPDRCVPHRVTADTSLWIHEVGGDRPAEDDIRSFFLYKDERLFFALLDPKDLVATSFAEQRPTEAITERTSSGPPIRIKMMWKDRRFLQERIYDEPSVDEPLCGYAGTPEETDYSGRRLCKRLRVYLPETELAVTLTDHVRITVPPTAAPSVSLSCSNPPRGPEATAPRERCEDRPLAAAYTANTRFRPSGVPVLSFPVRLVGGEPISEVLRIENGPDCGPLGVPCLVAKGRANERAYPIGVIAALGSGDSERHLIDATYFPSPRWLWALLAAASLQLLFIIGLRSRRGDTLPLYPAAVVGAALLLLTVRLLFAYKVVALFPHDQEAMDLAISAIMIVPALLAAIAWPAAKIPEPRAYRSSLWPLDARWLAGLRAAVVGAAVLLLCARLDVVSPPDRLLTTGWLLGLAAITFIASGVLNGALCGLRATVIRLRQAIPIARLQTDDDTVLPARGLWFALALLLLVRGLLAVYGRESLGGVRVLLWFLPSALLLTGVVLGRLQDQPRRAMIATIGVAAALFLAQWTDKGAGVVVCVPVVAIGLFLSARGLRQTPASRVVLGVALVAALGTAALWTWARITEASLPPVRDGPSRWSLLSQTDGGKNLLCPVSPKGKDGALDLERYAPLFDLSNTEVRLREFLVPGAATRIGTRVSTRVAESLAIMRRYAAGKETSMWGSGYLSAPVREYGRHELRALLSDGVSSVLGASEGGTAGILGLMGLYLLLLWIALGHAGLTSDRRALPFEHVWPGLIALFSLAWMTWFMCAGNIGLLLFSGQNVPFLVVQSGMDVVLPTLLFMLALSLPSAEETR